MSIGDKRKYTFITSMEYEDLTAAGYDVENAFEGSTIKVVESLVCDDEAEPEEQVVNEEDLKEEKFVDEVELEKENEIEEEVESIGKINETERHQNDEGRHDFTSNEADKFDDVDVQQEDVDDSEEVLLGKDDWTRPVVHSDDDSDDATIKNSTPKKVWDDIADLRDVELGLRSRFKNAKVFRLALKHYAVKKGFDYHYTKNERKQVGVVCKQDNCGFYIWCHMMPDSTDLEIRTLNPEHTCERVVDNKRITSDFLASRCLNQIRDIPNIDIPSFQKIVYRDIKVNVNEQRLYRAIRRAKTMIVGDTSAQYSKLYEYLSMITKTNPHSKWKVHVEHQAMVGEERTIPRFQRLYIRFGPEKTGFLQGCRPFVGIDGCHLKGYYGGQLLSVVSWDANDGMFPLAFGIVEAENKESWKWFLKELFDDYDNNDQLSWVFISDKQKGLVELFRDWIPNVEHRYCMRHMYENWYKEFKSEALKKKLWECAKATSAEKFEKKMEELKELDNDAYCWLRARPAKEWCKAFFTSRAKSIIQTNSLSECFNNWIAKGRDLPIYSLCEFLRKKVMLRFNFKKTQYQNYQRLLCPNIYLQMEINKEESRSCFALPSGNGYYEVDDGGELFAVNLNEKKCSCMDFQLSGIPCRYAMTAIIKKKDSPNSYVSQYYHMETFKKIYSGQIFPVLSEDDWPRIDLEPLQPPIIQKPPGRPRLKRKKNAAEGVQSCGNPYKASKKGLKITCSICKEKGHNARSCTPKNYGETPAQRKQRLSRNALAASQENEEIISGTRKKISKTATTSGGRGGLSGPGGGGSSSTDKFGSI